MPQTARGHKEVWDARKAAANERKHSVGFLEATTVFDDSLSMMISDPAHSVGEQRYLLLGMSSQRRLLVVGARREERIDPDHQRATCHPSREASL